MKYIKTLSSYAVASSLGTLLAVGFAGCNSNNEQQTHEAQQAKGAFVVIEEVSQGRYQIKEEFPSDETRIILNELNGTQRVLTQEEMDRMIQEEAAKIDAGTSNLTSSNPQMHSGGMSMGEALLASAAGAMLGAWIGSKLFGNANYQNNRKAGYKSPSAYTKSNNSFNQPKKSTTSGRSGFFGSSKSSSGSSSFGS